MKDKIVLITGASSGIGKATAQELARQGVTLILVSRNEQRGMEILKEIKAEIPAAKLSFYPCDLSSLSSVRQLGQKIIQNYSRIDVLINNAGILPGKYQTSADGFELSWATNHLGPFLFTNLLLPLVQQASQGRIINVSSEAHRLGQIEFNRAMVRKNYSSLTAYCDSKLANILFTYELARRLELTNVTANTLHPGVIASNFGTTGNGVLHWFFKVSRRFLKTPEEGAATTIFLATSPAVNQKTGLYFKNKKPVKSSRLSYNQGLAQRLWKISEEQTFI